MEALVDSGRLDAIVGSEHEFKPLIVAGAYLYLQKMLHLENRFAEVMRRRLDAEIASWPEEQVERAQRRAGATVGSRRTGSRAARRTASGGTFGGAISVTIVSGGPGTGKTTIVISMLRVLSPAGHHL